MDTNTAYEKNGFDLLRYAAACSVMLLHYSSFCMILSKNLPEKTAAVMSGIRKAALLFPWLVTQIVGIANTPACLKSLPTGSVNGALWTVFTEVQLYLVLGMLYPFLKKMKDRHWAAFLSVLAVLNLGCGWGIAGVVCLWWANLVEVEGGKGILI